MKEMLDVLAENGIKTGETIDRKEAHKKGVWHRSARIWLINNNQEVLLQKRALGKTYPGLWDLSCGGHISAGNASLYTAVTEIKEELGVDVKPEYLKLLGQYKYSHSEEGFIDNSFYDVYLARANYPMSSSGFKLKKLQKLSTLKFQN